jgi:D-alanine-D-alanine ligase-like ATP-grasp enzyme
MMDEANQAMPLGRIPSTRIGIEKCEKKPLKTFTKVPANYSELSEEERKEWAAQAAQRITESLRARDRGTGRGPRN